MSTTRIAEAIDYYHELLTGEFRQDILDFLPQALTNPHILVAGRPVCNVLRPYFIDRQTYNYVRDSSGLIMRAIGRLGQALMEDVNLRIQIDLSQDEEEAIHIDMGYGAHDLSARLDGFLTPDKQFHFVEYNADSPGGIAFGEVISEIFGGLPLLKTFGKRFPWMHFHPRHTVFNVLISTYHRWGGSGLPNIAIIDWRGVSTYNEFLLSQSYFESKGCRVKVADPGELEFRDGGVYIGDFPIQLIYKRLLVGDILTKLGIKHPLVEAVRRRAVCMVNGFRVQMLFKKMIFALLSDPVNEHLFDSTTNNAIARHIPWTRRVKECKTTYKGRTVDLIPFIAQNRDHLVLKPNAEYGGRGVVLGWECEDSHWAEALQNAVDTSYVVQERVPVAKESFPSLIEGEIRFNDRYFDLDPYVWDGARIEGCGVRLSSMALLNVAGGGSATPMFVLE
ncbi:MAG: hypothetical protein C5B54_09425 [Acidobacteria bacterium]|nr:MAG: hypothetical protein C5B54_09425 [Acidobacteriota bacterium]